MGTSQPGGSRAQGICQPHQGLELDRTGSLPKGRCHTTLREAQWHRAALLLSSAAALVTVHALEAFLTNGSGHRRDFWRHHWHVAWNHGRNHRSPAAGGPGHHPPVAGKDCRVGSADRGTPAAGEGQDAAKLFAAAQQATSTRPAAAAQTQVEEETWRAGRPRETGATLDSHGPM